MRTEAIALAWWRTRRAMRLSSALLAGRREGKWRALQPALRATPALAGFADRALADFPVTEPAIVRADYGRWNSLGLSHSQCLALADTAERGEETGEIAAGWSSGTGDGSVGGARGLFLTTAAERADYIGQSIARLLPPRAMLHRQRIALHLRANNALYTDVAGRRIGFAYFALDAPVEQTAAAMARYDPSILIAPPHRLIALAQLGASLPALAHLFYGSEPMSDAECAFVAERLELAPRPIWQATEGFLGAACQMGRLHLNDHALEIELEPVAGTRGGFRPIITDLHRRSQPVVRLRGDDLIELDPRGACPCGYGGRTILPIAGRVGDLWRFAEHAPMPRAIIDCVEAAIGGAIRWQAAANPLAVSLRTAPDCPPPLATRAAQSLAAILPVPVHSVRDLPAWPGPKRRKLVWTDG